MHRTPSAPARALRGVVVAGVGLGLAYAGHLDAGGSAAVTPLVVLVALLVTAASVLASQRSWTVVRLVVALLGMQLATHAVLWFDSGARAVDGRLASLASAGGAQHHAAVPSGSSLGMVAAHVVAALVAATLLGGADAALAVLQALARRIVAARVGAPTALPRPSATGGVHVVVLRIVELGAVGRRGPPGSPAPA